MKQDQALLSSHPSAEIVFSPSLWKQKISDSCHSEKTTQQHGLFTRCCFFGGLKLCGLVLIPGNAWT